MSQILILFISGHVKAKLNFQLQNGFYAWIENSESLEKKTYVLDLKFGIRIIKKNNLNLFLGFANELDRQDIGEEQLEIRSLGVYSSIENKKFGAALSVFPKVDVKDTSELDFGLRFDLAQFFYIMPHWKVGPRLTYRYFEGAQDIHSFRPTLFTAFDF